MTAETSSSQQHHYTKTNANCVLSSPELLIHCLHAIMTNSSAGSDAASPKAKRSKSPSRSPTKKPDATPQLSSPRPKPARVKTTDKVKTLWDAHIGASFPPRLPQDPFECVMSSCPELCQRSNDASVDYFNSQPRRNSRSQPPTPSSLSRLALRFRSKRIWRSIGGSSYHRSPPRHVDVSPHIMDGKERRRRARESKARRLSSEMPQSQGTSQVGGAASPLAIVGMKLAMEELDRLSTQARSEEGGEKSSL